MRKRNHTVTIRMNKEEYELLQSKVKAHLRMCLFCSCISVGFLLAIAPDSARVGKPKATKGHQNSYQENELKFYFCSC